VNATMPTFGTLQVNSEVNVTSIAQAATDTTLLATTPWLVIVVKNIKLPTTRDNYPVAPDFLLNVYREHIIDGVVGRMLMQAGKSHTNPQLGKYHLARYRDGITIARNDIWYQNVIGGQRWYFPQQFAASSQRNIGSAWPRGM
jgi:hypothetical protein